MFVGTDAVVRAQVEISWKFRSSSEIRCLTLVLAAAKQSWGLQNVFILQTFWDERFVGGSKWVCL